MGTQNSFSAGNFFKNNPEKVLGEAYEASGRFGKVTKYKGEIDAIEKIDVKLDFLPSDTQYDPFSSTKEVSVADTPTDVMRKERMEQANEVSPVEENKKKKKKVLGKSIYIEPTGESKDLLSFKEVFDQYNPEITLDELNAFAYWKNHYSDDPMSGEWLTSGLVKNPSEDHVKDWVKKQALCYYKGDLVPQFLYISENIYDKKTALQEDKDTIISLYGADTYDKQESLLKKAFQAQYENRLRIDHVEADKRLIILPTSIFAREFMIKTLSDEMPFNVKVIERKKGFGTPDFQAEAEGRVRRGRDRTLLQEMSLINAFRLWIVREKDNIKFLGMSNYREVLDYMRGASRPKDTEKEEWARIQSRAKANAERLFMEFLANNLLVDDRDRLELDWNQKFNSYIKPDYDKVPVAFRVGKYFRGEPFEMRWEKREAVAFMMVENSGCIGYGVGYGKTLSAIFSILQFMDAGLCKRPMIVVPNQTYKQWISEIRHTAPHIKINDLYNLREQYRDELVGIGGEIMKVDENSITMLTFEGFEMLSFNESTEADIKGKLYTILSQGGDEFTSAKKGDRKKAMLMEKIETLMGRGAKGGVVNIEDLGVDFFCMDEAHNAKKVFTRVQGKPAENEGGRSRQEYKIQSGQPSNRGLKAFMVAHYVMHNNNQRNVMLLTATPFTNSPLEVFSTLALVAWKKLEEMGISNLNNFFDTYIDVEDDLVINAQLKPVRKQVVAGFNNLKALQQLLYRFINYKDADMADSKGRKVNLIRPNKIVLPYDKKDVDGQTIVLEEGERASSILPLTPLQGTLMKDIISYAEGNLSLSDVCESGEEADFEGDKSAEDKDQTEAEALSEENLEEDEKVGVRTLRAVNFARSLSLSPYLYKCSGLTNKPSYTEYIETSNKLKYVMECIRTVKQYHEGKNEPVSGQIIYMDRGVEYFPLVKEYLVKEVGYKEHEIGIMKSTMSEADLRGIDKSRIPKYAGGEKNVILKAYIQNLFLGQYFDEKIKDFRPIDDSDRIKVVIGSSTIREGVNLQKYSTVLYNCFLDWNPTDFAQLVGRLWRQGNTFKNVRIVVPLMENSMDIFIFQKLSEKTNRINAIWNLNGKTNVLNLQEFDPKELKFALIRDPRIMAQMDAEEKKLTLVDERAEVEAEIKTLVGAKEMHDYIEAKRGELVDEAKSVRASKVREGASLDNLIALVMDAIKTQKNDKGVKFDKDESVNWQIKNNGYKGNSVMGHNWYDGNYEFDTFRANYRKLKAVQSKILDPRQLRIKDIDKVIETLTKDSERLGNAMEEVMSESSIAHATEEFAREQEEKQVVTKPLQARVKEFANLNYLLSEKREKQAKATPKLLPPELCPPVDAEGIPLIDDEALSLLENCLQNQAQTKADHYDYDAKKYTPERRKVHRDIIAEFLSGSNCISEGQPVAVLTGGVPASGKTRYITEKAKIDWINSTDVFKIDADAVRSRLPEYKGWNANSTHEETKDIVKEMISTVGKPCKYDMVFDGTMNSGRNYIPLIESIKKLGFKVFMIYVKVPSYEIALNRALKRYQRTGRYVPLTVIEDAWKNSERTFRDIRKLADGWVLVDGVTSEILEQGGEDIPKTRDYDKISKTEVIVGEDDFEIQSISPEQDVKNKKIKLAKAKAKAQKQKIEIMKLKLGLPSKMDGGEMVTGGNVEDEKHTLLYNFVDEQKLEGDEDAENLIGKKGYSTSYDDLYNYVDEKGLEGNEEASVLLEKVNSMSSGGSMAKGGGLQKVTMDIPMNTVITKKNGDQFDIPLKVMRKYDDGLGVGSLQAIRPIMTIAKNQFNKWEIVDGSKAMEASDSDKDKYVAIGEKDGYWTILSRPTDKKTANDHTDGATKGEVGRVVTLAEAKAHKQVLGKEYLMAKGGEASVTPEQLLEKIQGEAGWFCMDAKADKNKFIAWIKKNGNLFLDVNKSVKAVQGNDSWCTDSEDDINYFFQEIGMDTTAQFKEDNDLAKGGEVAGQDELIQDIGQMIDERVYYAYGKFKGDRGKLNSLMRRVKKAWKEAKEYADDPEEEFSNSPAYTDLLKMLGISNA